MSNPKPLALKFFALYSDDEMATISANRLGFKVPPANMANSQTPNRTTVRTNSTRSHLPLAVRACAAIEFELPSAARRSAADGAWLRRGQFCKRLCRKSSGKQLPHLDISASSMQTNLSVDISGRSRRNRRQQRPTDRR